MKRIVLVVLLTIVPVIAFMASTKAHSEIVPGLPDVKMGKPNAFRTEVLPDGRKIVHFDVTMGNVGAGNFEVGCTRPDSTSTFTCHQRIYSSPTAYTDVSLPNVQVEYQHHESTDIWHWHMQSVYDVDLIDQSGNVVRSMPKQGFCFWDSDDNRGNPIPSEYHDDFFNPFPSCGQGDATLPANNPIRGPQATILRYGLTPTWSDTYTGFFINQYIDVTGLPKGHYTLRARMNPDLGFQESNYVNSTAVTGLNVQ